MKNRTIKFRAWNPMNDTIMDAISIQHLAMFTHLNESIVMNLKFQQFTGLQDKKGNDIYEGDILSDTVKVDGKNVKSALQVFWNEHTGSWHLDMSFKQDTTTSIELWHELNDFKYTIIGNIYENKELLNNKNTK